MALAHRTAAATGLGAVLAVVLASAAIRLNSASPSALPFLGAGEVGALRLLHRTAASIELLVALWLAWHWFRERRRRAAAGTLLAITVLLAAIGIAGGRTPPPLLALGNVLGGLALVAGFAWLLAAMRDGGGAMRAPTAIAITVLVAVQASIGAWLSIAGHGGGTGLAVHIFIGLALAALLWRLALSRANTVLLILGAVAPIAGFTALQYQYSGAAALAHAAAAAALIAATAAFLARMLDSHQGSGRRATDNRRVW